MSNGANTALSLQRAVAAIALVLVLGFAPVACAAMVSQPQADSHPCCPKPGHADSNPCAKTGCVANVPALRAAPTEFGIVLPAVVQAVAAPAARISEPERGWEAKPHFSQPDVFLQNHSLLI